MNGRALCNHRGLLALALLLLPHVNLCLRFDNPVEVVWPTIRAGQILLEPAHCHQQFLERASRWLPNGTGFGRFGPKTLEAEFGGRKPRIVIASFFQHLANPSAYFKDILKNLEAYAAKHGYGLFAPTVVEGSEEALRWTRGRGPGWAKVKVLEFLFSGNRTGEPAPDYVFWSDADSIILNDNIRLEDFAELGRDLVLSTDWNGINTGHMLLRNSNWSRHLLPRVWQHCPPTTFAYEQEGIAAAVTGGNWHLLLPNLVNKVLRARLQLGTHDNAHKAWQALPEESREHMYITGRCTMNSGLEFLHRDDFVYHPAGGFRPWKYEQINGLSQSLRERPLLFSATAKGGLPAPDWLERTKC